jgi:hypothetical protein
MGDFFMSGQRSEAVTKIRHLFRAEQRPLTLKEIRESLPDLKAPQISSTLCYFMRQKYVIREPIENVTPKERKKVWLYTYNDNRYLGTTNEN